METANRRLMWHGMLLFLLGLITGFLEQHFANVRMGLAAHLEGVMNGIFLLVLGAIWAQVQLPRTAKGGAYWTALYGTYVNWLFTTLLRSSAPRRYLPSLLRGTQESRGRKVL
jgi:hydroxylaminobenzene mutase